MSLEIPKIAFTILLFLEIPQKQIKIVTFTCSTRKEKTTIIFKIEINFVSFWYYRYKQ